MSRQIKKTRFFKKKKMMLLVEVEGVVFLLPHSLERVEVELLLNGVRDQLGRRVLQVLVPGVETWIRIGFRLLLDKE